MPVTSKVVCLKQRNGQVLRNFRFNYVVGEKTQQAELYQRLNVDHYLESAMAGYSVTIFAYGQTGSGKTYTMAGIEEKFNQEFFKSDETDGVIPRAIKNLWYGWDYKGSTHKKEAKSTQSKHHSHRFTMSKLKTF